MPPELHHGCNVLLKRCGRLFLIFLLTMPTVAFAIPQADFIMVKKSEAKLYLIKKGKVLREYHIALGANPKGHKQQQGDGRTPEGRYIIDYKNSQSSFYKSIHISYPNQSDIRGAKKAHVNPGGAIMIHGQKNGWGWASFVAQHFNWTDGCIAVTNKDMDEIWDAVKVGTPIEIKHWMIAKSLEAEFQKQNPSSEIKETFNHPQKLYFEAIELKKKGKLALAMVKLSEAYGEENIAVDSYYQMLDRERMSILKDIKNGVPWFSGAPDKKNSFKSIKNQFHALHSRPDFSIYHVPSSRSLPYERFLNYRIVQETSKRSPRQWLKGPDPWMVSTVLFLAGKRVMKIRPDDVIRRWENRPDLWDDICMNQALFYLGTLKPDRLKALNIKNEDIRMDIQPLMEAANRSLLLGCSSRFDSSRHLLSIDMSVKEKVAYESLKRVEISVRSSEGKEYFRAMNNRMSHPAPIPPNAFGLFPVGEKKKLSLKDIKSAGMEAAITVKNRYGYLIDGCKTTYDKGILAIHWKIHSEGWQFPDGKGYIFVKIVPKREKDAPWMNCASFVYKMQQL